MFLLKINMNKLKKTKPRETQPKIFKIIKGLIFSVHINFAGIFMELCILLLQNGLIKSVHNLLVCLISAFLLFINKYYKDRSEIKLTKFLLLIFWAKIIIL